ncbi:MBL fold metallo-hydrolase [Fundidesulfovibrio agrisoli]|uniref:MBL fold metallo-hydrolase n=1 Tax=Fundidesulfovibrio agrisoli TaxID=2922717 RepID=UPI001FAC5D67|nr:MBL fold metallo-hydrolase [Fundidesulfovibrio agrisoli]
MPAQPRKHSWRNITALSLLCAALGLAQSAIAGPPAQVKTQAPGYFRMMLGDFEVTALLDGMTKIPVEYLKGVKTEEAQRTLERVFAPADGGMQTAINAYLVHTGANLVLIDAGGGSFMGPKAGHLPEAMRAADYAPEQVDAVLLTHGHRDHLGGLVDAQGAAAFPNATLFIAAPEAAYWVETDPATQPQDKRPRFELARKVTAPYKAAGKYRTFAPGDEILPGLTAVDLIGHTPGHCGVMLRSKGQAMLVWGDVIHSHATQFAKPRIAIEFDTDQAKAVAARKRVLAEAASEGCWVAGLHLPFPGIGHVLKTGGGYAWVPVEYAPMP